VSGESRDGPSSLSGSSAKRGNTVSSCCAPAARGSYRVRLSVLIPVVHKYCQHLTEPLQVSGNSPAIGSYGENGLGRNADGIFLVEGHLSDCGCRAQVSVFRHGVPLRRPGRRMETGDSQSGCLRGKSHSAACGGRGGAGSRHSGCRADALGFPSAWAESPALRRTRPGPSPTALTRVQVKGSRSRGSQHPLETTPAHWAKPLVRKNSQPANITIGLGTARTRSRRSPEAGW
jgi:hypothetical protein